MKDKIFGVLQRVGRSFMLPIAILPVAGLLLGIIPILIFYFIGQKYIIEGVVAGSVKG